ncbi:MAG: ammonium transporter [Oscillospiraceae bacterium]|jgi:Amt family ammonium transporter|nr:ammonium transporter [Oscillospiraceae bacterium]
MDTKVILDTIWVLLAGMLVFFMNLGFASVETGLTRQKNVVNILSKNFIVFAISSLGFLLLGWGLMFGDGSGFMGLKGLFFASGADNSPATGDAYRGVYSAISWTGIPFWAKFFFQLVFCGTAATIVSGTVAERVKYISFIVFSFFLTLLVYPIVGHWIWGGGFLAQLGMLDFAGGSVVHSVGGWAALTGAIILGPRLGKYTKDGRIHPIPGHNMGLATIGAFVLWLGWFGFNPGSTMAAEPTSISHILVVTNTSGVIAVLTATAASWLVIGKPDLGMSINGLLAGLVAITPCCAFVSVSSSLIIGAISGVLVVFAVMFFDRIKIDDPVGALSVHLVHGVLGTLFVGLFAQDGIGGISSPNGLFFGGGLALLGKQAFGILCVAAFTAAATCIIWYAIKATLGLRVSAQEELEGLDIGEHGQKGYPDFATIDYTGEYSLPGQKLAALGAAPESLSAPVAAPAVPVEQAVPVTVVSSPAPAGGVKLTKVEIITKQIRLEALKDAMDKIGITGMTVTNVLGYGIQGGTTEYYRGVEFETNLLPKIKIEIVVSAVPVRTVIEAAKRVLYTGHIGDGKVFVYDVENVVKVRTGEEGYDALQDVE